MRRIVALILFFIVVFGGIYILFEKRTPSSQTTTDTLSVETSFYPMYYFASVIGGDKATVHNITPAGAEPHDYELSAQDVRGIINSSLLVLNGAGLEPWREKIEENLVGTDTHVVVASDGLAKQQIEEEGETIQDPHVWLSPILAKEEVKRIEEGFITKDPKNASYYKKNADALLVRLDELDTAYQKGLASCEKKDIVTSHSAFGYLANAYGLTQVAISGLSPDEEPSAKDLATVSDFAKSQGIKYIFFESLVSPKLSQTIANEIGAQTLVLDPIEGLSDNEIESGANYFTKMEQNLENLRKALACT